MEILGTGERVSFEVLFDDHGVYRFKCCSWLKSKSHSDHC